MKSQQTISRSNIFDALVHYVKLQLLYTAPKDMTPMVTAKLNKLMSYVGVLPECNDEFITREWRNISALLYEYGDHHASAFGSYSELELVYEPTKPLLQ